MAWVVLDLANLPGWIADQHRYDDPPVAYALAPPSDLADRAAPLADWGEDVRWTAGGLSIRLTDPDRDEEMLNAAIRLVALDERQLKETSRPHGEETWAPTAVTAEFGLLVNGLEPVGPGGRIIYYRRARRLTVAFHLRTAPLGGAWRDPRAVAAEARAELGVRFANDVRLRVGLGYHEASGWQPQELLRPAFVVIAERLRRDGQPRWRFASVQAATDVDVAPPAAGIRPAAAFA